MTVYHVLGKLFFLENITIEAYLPHKQIGSLFLPAEYDAFIIDNIVIKNYFKRDLLWKVDLITQQVYYVI